MKKLLPILALLMAGTVPGIALAGPGGTTCATAEQLFPLEQLSGDTSAAGYGNPVGAVGPLPSPANDAIYMFTSNGQATTSIAFTGQYTWAIYLTTTCAGTAAPPLEAASGAPGAAGNLLIDNGSGGALTAGTTYYVIVTGDPSQPASSNGAFSFSTPDFPVSLQSFTID